MSETSPGAFELSTTLTYAGLYYVRALAKGVTLRGVPFTREHLATAAVWRGGDQPYAPPAGTGNQDWCRLITCLLSDKVLSRESEALLKRAGVNVDGIRECVKRNCRRASERRDG